MDFKPQKDNEFDGSWTIWSTFGTKMEPVLAPFWSTFGTPFGRRKLQKHKEFKGFLRFSALERGTVWGTFGPISGPFLVHFGRFREIHRILKFWEEF